MKILITGANGFIGCHLTAYLLKRGHEVVGLDSHGTIVPTWLQEMRAKYASANILNCDILNAKCLTAVLNSIQPQSDI